MARRAAGTVTPSPEDRERLNEFAVELREWGFDVVASDELARLRGVDAKYGWRERSATTPLLHHFRAGRWPWICQVCGYGPGEALKHFREART